jgi:hypothetical protein
VKTPDLEDLYDALRRDLAAHYDRNVVFCQLRLPILGLLELGDNANDFSKLRITNWEPTVHCVPPRLRNYLVVNFDNYIRVIFHPFVLKSRQSLGICPLLVGFLSVAKIVLFQAASEYVSDDIDLMRDRHLNSCNRNGPD